ncbi:unnamed protein product [Phytophthora fragariaefolia]|uniref:Unnamed protein product n=1 Tax=Phytophthora fragariaefolia TaxID=1490495 RepID=A0A9W6Y522_9STRA|nr:unnamed protein product [Phytophthora fragariaefolia]
MCSTMNVVQGLIKIFELREAIRHQRRVNKQTYLQLTEIHVELQLLHRTGSLQDNITLRRNATVKKFECAVNKFVAYLQKYNNMNRFLRIFKRGEMEAERQQIVADIEQLFRMLGLATSVAMMNGNASAAKTADKFLSKLQDVHTDVKLTHDQVQAALLGLLEKRKDAELEQELVAQKPVLKRTHSPAVQGFSVPLLMEKLESDQKETKDKTLLALIQKCITSNSRVQVYKADGIQLFAGLVQGDESYFTKLYALHCLSWFTFIYSKMPEMEFETLRSCIPGATLLQIQSLIRNLQFGTNQEKEDAAILCSCMATRGDADILRTTGVLEPLIHVLEEGTPNQKLWAAESLGTLASNNDENCMAIARGKAIQPLISLLRSGTDMQKQEAAYALGNLAADNDVNRATIAREGAIPPMVAFVKAVTDAQNQWAVYALGTLSLSNEANRVAIAQEGAIAPLVALLRGGASAQKQWAAYTIGNLAYNDANRAEITLEGAIKPLVKLLGIGTDAQKQWAAYALGNLACDNEEAMDLDDAILPLVELVRTGSDPQKQEAAYTLGNLAASNDGNSNEIGREATAPLVGLLYGGTSEQKQWAAYALACLAENNDVNRAAIMNEGAITPLVALALDGTGDQEVQAVRALGSLACEHDENQPSIPAKKIVASLVEFLRMGTTSQKASAAAALKKLARMCEDNRNMIVQEGAIPLLDILVNTGTDVLKHSAIDLLETLRPDLIETMTKAANAGHILRSVAVGWVAS